MVMLAVDGRIISLTFGTIASALGIIFPKRFERKCKLLHCFCTVGKGKTMTKKPSKFDGISILHRFTCVFGALITVCCLFRCYLSATNALQDVYKFEHTGTFQYFLYFLDEYHFSDEMCTFLLMIGELLVYGVQYHHIAQQRNPIRGSVWYFVIMFVFHTVIWLHANSIPMPEWPYERTADAVFCYMLFANMTILPSAAYLVSYIMRLRKTNHR